MVETEATCNAADHTYTCVAIIELVYIASCVIDKKPSPDLTFSLSAGSMLALYHLLTCNNCTTSLKTPLHGQTSIPLCVRPAQKSCDRTALFQKFEVQKLFNP